MCGSGITTCGALAHAFFSPLLYLIKAISRIAAFLEWSNDPLVCLKYIVRERSMFVKRLQYCYPIYQKVGVKWEMCSTPTDPVNCICGRLGGGVMEKPRNGDEQGRGKSRQCERKSDASRLNSWWRHWSSGCSPFVHQLHALNTFCYGHCNRLMKCLQRWSWQQYWQPQWWLYHTINLYKEVWTNLMIDVC